MNKRAVTVAQMKRARRVLEAAGQTVSGITMHPDGSVTILTANGNTPSPIDPLDAELAEWDAKHGHDRP